jgi:hypothetical protein
MSVEMLLTRGFIFGNGLSYQLKIVAIGTRITFIAGERFVSETNALKGVAIVKPSTPWFVVSHNYVGFKDEVAL